MSSAPQSEDTRASPSLARQLPRRDAWRLAQMLAGGPPVSADTIASALGRELLEVITQANGLGPRGTLEAYLAAHYVAVQTAIVREILAERPDGEEPADAEAALAEEPRYKLLRAADALQPRLPRAAIVEGLIYDQDVVMWYGDAGSKKTYAALDLAVSVAQGRTEWLGCAVRQGTVLIIDEESGEDRLLRRLGDVMRGHGAPAALPLIMTSLALFDFGHLADLRVLEALIAAEHPSLVIIDAWMDVLPGADENSGADMLPALRHLRAIAERQHCAFLVIHHANKNGGYRGHSSLKGKVDQLLLVTSDPESPNIDLKTEKTRDSGGIHIAAAAHFGIGTFHLSATGTVAPQARVGTGERYVLRYLEEHGASAVAALMAAADTCSPETARKAIYRLAALHLIRRVDDGGRGSEAVYDLPASDASAVREVPWD